LLSGSIGPVDERIVTANWRDYMAAQNQTESGYFAICRRNTAPKCVLPFSEAHIYNIYGSFLNGIVLALTYGLTI
jgi:hypothetical protein